MTEREIGKRCNLSAHFVTWPADSGPWELRAPLDSPASGELQTWRLRFFRCVLECWCPEAEKFGVGWPDHCYPIKLVFPLLLLPPPFPSHPPLSLFVCPLAPALSLLPSRGGLAAAKRDLPGFAKNCDRSRKDTSPEMTIVLALLTIIVGKTNLRMC